MRVRVWGVRVFVGAVAYLTFGWGRIKTRIKTRSEFLVQGLPWHATSSFLARNIVLSMRMNSLQSCRRKLKDREISLGLFSLFKSIFTYLQFRLNLSNKNHPGSLKLLVPRGTPRIFSRETEQKMHYVVVSRCAKFNLTCGHYHATGLVGVPT